MPKARIGGFAFRSALTMNLQSYAKLAQDDRDVPAATSRIRA